MLPMPPVTQALLLINVAAFCIGIFAPLFTGLLALWPLGHGFMPWQVVTYAFLHGSVLHLFFNMLGLWMFGGELERLWGVRRFVQFYFASVLTALAAADPPALGRYRIQRQRPRAQELVGRSIRSWARNNVWNLLAFVVLWPVLRLVSTIHAGPPPPGWVIGAQVLFFVYLDDFLYYWFHRLSHEINAFWAAHVVHHQSEEYNLAVALRQGTFQGVFSWVFYLPLAVLGFPPLVFLTVSSIDTLYQFWIHTRVIGRLGPLEWVLNTPSNHRVHHAKNPQYIDKNCGGALIIWDRMFGTYAAEVEPPVFGVLEMPTRPFNPFYLQLYLWRDLLLQSFRRKSSPSLQESRGT